MDRQFTQEEIEIIRRTLIFMHEIATLSRKYICEKAGLSPTQFDNFTKKVPDGTRYKSKRPSNSIILKIVSFIMSEKTSRPVYSSVLPDIDKINSWNIGEIPSQIDYMFEYLKSIGLTTDLESRILCKTLSGNYYTYRPSTDGKYIVKAFMYVKPYNSKDRTPRFVHVLQDMEGNQRISTGQVIDFGPTLAFFGFTESRRKTKWSGIKVIIMNRPPHGRVIRMRGLYLSSDGADNYSSGKMFMLRTSDNMRTKSIGLLTNSEYLQKNGQLISGFSLENLKIDVDDYKSLSSILMRVGE